MENSRHDEELVYFRYQDQRFFCLLLYSVVLIYFRYLDQRNVLLTTLLLIGVL
jgi:hypothetical protein